MNFKLKVVYEFNGLRKEIESSDENVNLEYLHVEENKGIIHQVNFHSDKEIKLIDVKLVGTYHFRKDDYIFCNGYQSWTDSFEHPVNGKMKSLSKLPQKIIDKFSFDRYGDSYFLNYNSKKGRFHGFSYSYIRNNDDYLLLGSINDFNAFTILNFDVKNNEVSIQSDVKDVVKKGDFVLLKFLEIRGDENEVFSNYKKYFNKKVAKCIEGYTSWYNYYQDINEEKVLKELDLASKSHLKLFQIDDGWEEAIGDFLSIDKVKFPSGLQPIVNKIHENKMLAGVWAAPFVGETKSNLYQEHKELFAKDQNGNLIKAGCNWSRFYCLDIYNPETRKYIENVLDFLVKENRFDLLKLDFLYAACIPQYKNKTRAEVMKDVMDIIKEHTKNTLVIGCGVPLYSAIGCVDYCRIGPDTSLKFDDVWFMKFMHRERISTKINIQNIIYRRQLNNMWFNNDPDAYLLRDFNISMNENQKLSLGILSHLFGKIYMSSDCYASFNNKQIENYHTIKQFEDYTCSKVKRNGNFIEFLAEKDNEVYEFKYSIKKGILNYGKK